MSKQDQQPTTTIESVHMNPSYYGDDSKEDSNETTAFLPGERPHTDKRAELLRWLRMTLLIGTLIAMQEWAVEPTVENLHAKNTPWGNVVAVLEPILITFLEYMLMKNTQVMQRLYNLWEKCPNSRAKIMEVKATQSKLIESLMNIPFFGSLLGAMCYIAYNFPKDGPTEEQGLWIGVGLPQIITQIFVILFVSGLIPKAEKYLQRHILRDMTIPTPSQRIAVAIPMELVTAAYCALMATEKKIARQLNPQIYSWEATGGTAATYLLMTTAINIWAGKRDPRKKGGDFVNAVASSISTTLRFEQGEESDEERKDWACMFSRCCRHSEKLEDNDTEQYLR